jgi:hypothetical protein
MPEKPRPAKNRAGSPASANRPLLPGVSSDGSIYVREVPGDAWGLDGLPEVPERKGDCCTLLAEGGVSS